MILIWILRLLLIISVIGMVGYLFYIGLEPRVWSTDKDDSDKQKILRVQERGTILSIVSAVVLGLVSVMLVQTGVRDGDIRIHIHSSCRVCIGYRIWNWWGIPIYQAGCYQELGSIHPILYDELLLHSVYCYFPNGHVHQQADSRGYAGLFNR